MYSAKLSQREHPGLAVDQREVDDAERSLQVILEQFVLDDLDVRAAFALDDDADAVAVGLVAQVRDPSRSPSLTSSAMRSTRRALLVWKGVR